MAFVISVLLIGCIFFLLSLFFNWWYIPLIILSVIFLIRLIVLLVRFLIFKYSHQYEQKVRLFVAETGTGKTSLVVAQMIHYYKKYNDYIRKVLSPIYNTLQKNGLIDYKIPDCMIYSDIDIALTGTLQDYSTLHNMVVMSKNGESLSANDERFINSKVMKSNFYEFTDLDFQVFDSNNASFENICKLPIGAVGVFDEIANKVDSRNFNDFTDGKSGLLRLHRKAYLNLNFIYPNFTDADKRIRENCHEINLVLGVRHKYSIFSHKLKKSIWTYCCYKGAGRNKIKDFESGKIPTRSLTIFQKFLGFDPPIETKKFVFKGNIFEHYESRAEISYFLKNYNDIKEVKQDSFNYSSTFVDYYCNTHPAFTPYEKRKKNIRLREKENIKKKSN